MDGTIDAAALYRAHAPFILSLVRRLGIPESEVDDVVQEIFVVAHRRGGYVPGPAKPRTWLAQIALHVASVTRRSARRRRTQADEETVARAVTDRSNPFDMAAATESLTRVQRALDALDDDHRTVFVLFELSGESCDAIGAILGIPVGTVYSRLHAARAGFRKEWDKQSEPKPAALAIMEAT